MNALQPCPAPTGSEARIDVYRDRLALGVPLNQPGDCEQTIPPKFDAGASRAFVPAIRQCRAGCPIPAE